MKHIILALLGASVIPILTGCSSHRTAQTAVGPHVGRAAMTGSQGYLQVFTAKQNFLPVASDDSWGFAVYSGFNIIDPAGNHIRFVPNHVSNMDAWPDTVLLPAGDYNVVGNSTWGGRVTVAVNIRPDKTTILNLDDNGEHPSLQR